MKTIVWAIPIAFNFLMLGCSYQKSETKTEDLKNKEIEILTENNELEVSLISQGLVNIQSLDSSLKVDLKYSSTENFFKQDVYGSLTRAYLQHIPAESLKKANYLIQSINKDYRLLIFDAVRPLHIQEVLWNSLDSIPPNKRKNFVSDPKEGSLHNYGCAVDLSIFDISKNEPLDMGTKFDYFGYLAYPRLESELLKQGKLTKTQIDNRILLRKVMVLNGFHPITSEWWHFNFYSRKTAKNLFKIIE